jgi:hypothetical protein
MATARQVLETAARDLGYVEGPNNWTVFSARVDGGKWQHQPWCGVWVRDVFNRVGMPNEPSSVWTPGGAEAYRNRGRWVPRYGDVRPGDVVYFDWGGTQNLPAIDHVGFVESLNGDGSLTTLEGNTSPTNAGSQSNGGGCYRRVRPRSVIAGFGRPAYGQEPPSPPVDWEALRRMAAAKILNEGFGQIPVIKQGTSGRAVLLWQQALNLVADARLAEDSSFGAATRDATLRFQRFFKLEADGVVGPKTRGMMEFLLAKIRG